MRIIQNFNKVLKDTYLAIKLRILRTVADTIIILVWIVVAGGWQPSTDLFNLFYTGIPVVFIFYVGFKTVIIGKFLVLISGFLIWLCVKLSPKFETWTTKFLKKYSTPYLFENFCGDCAFTDPEKFTKEIEVAGSIFEKAMVILGRGTIGKSALGLIAVGAGIFAIQEYTPWYHQWEYDQEVKFCDERGLPRPEYHPKKPGVSYSAVGRFFNGGPVYHPIPTTPPAPPTS